MINKEHFNKAYFNRLFVNPRTRVTTTAKVRTHFQAVMSVLDAYDVKVKSVLDLGCGLAPLRSDVKEFYDAKYTGIDISPDSKADVIKDVCSMKEKDRHLKGKDLIISQGVVHYFDDQEYDSDARRHIALCQKAKKAVLLMTLTHEDFKRHTTKCATEGLYVRSVDWYRERFHPQTWRELLPGLFVRKSLLRGALEMG